MEAAIGMEIREHKGSFAVYVVLRVLVIGYEVVAAAIRRPAEIIGDGRIFQFGIRSGERAEWYWSAEGHTKIQKFSFAGLDEATERKRYRDYQERFAIPSERMT